MPSYRIRLPVLAASGLLALTIACSGKGAAGDGNSAVVVSVGKAELKGETLARWLKESPTPPSVASAGLLISTWIDQAALATALSEGKTLDDSTTALEVIAPDAARGVLNNFWRARAKARPKVSDRSVDSLASRDEVRVFQHLFIDGSNAKDSVSRMAVIARMKAVVARLKKGESFTALVKETSEDTATVRNNGFLPAVTKTDLPEGLQGTAWSLEPGEVSNMLPSRIGLHLLRRASAAEAREGLRAWLVPRFGLREDTRYVDSIAASKKLTFAKNAVDRTRAMAAEPMLVGDNAPIATWDGGSLSPAQLRVWIGMLGPVERISLSGTADSTAFMFVRETALRELLLGMVSPGGPNTAEARGALLPLYRSMLDSVLVNVKEFSGKSPAEAATAVTDGLMKHERRYRPLPGALPVVLRTRYPVKVDTVALRAILNAVGPEYAKLHANDSSDTKTANPLPGAGAPKPIKP
jgi:hypothetical protein